LKATFSEPLSNSPYFNYYTFPQRYNFLEVEYPITNPVPAPTYLNPTLAICDIFTGLCTDGVVTPSYP